MKKLLILLLALLLCFALFACTSDEPTEVESNNTSYEPSLQNNEVDDWYGEYPEGFVPEESFERGLWNSYRNPEELVESADVLLTGTIVNAQFEWHHSGSVPDREGNYRYDPVIVYTVAVEEVFKTDIEIGETLEFRVLANYRNIVRGNSVPEILEVGGRHLFALGTFEDMRDDPRFVEHQRSVMPSMVTPTQWAYSLETNEPAGMVAFDIDGSPRVVEQDLTEDSVFTASEILALFE